MLSTCMVRKFSVSASESQVQKWDNYIDESYEVESRSELVRRAIEEFIEKERSGSSGVDEEMLQDIDERLSNVEEVMGAINSDVSVIRQQQPDKDLLYDIVKGGTEDIIEIWLRKFAEDHMNPIHEELGTVGEQE